MKITVVGSRLREVIINVFFDRGLPGYHDLELEMSCQPRTEICYSPCLLTKMSVIDIMER